MDIENLKLHYDLVKNENYDTSPCWVIVFSSKYFTKILKINEYIEFYPFEAINTEITIDADDSEVLVPFIERLKALKQINGQSGQNYYLLNIKLISPEVLSTTTQYFRIAFSYILMDLLHVLSLYYNRYFMLFPSNILNHSDICEKYGNRIKNLSFNYDEFEESSRDIRNNLNVLCDLRQEQFYMIQKSLDLYNNCLYAYGTNPSIALCFLISSIENPAKYYIEYSEEWDNYTHLSFYNSLKKTLKKVEDEELRKELFRKIGDKYLKESFQVKSRYQKFLLRFCNNNYHLLEDVGDKFFKEFTGDYYHLRSSYIHTGSKIIMSHYSSPILFNISKKGKIKTYEEGSILDVRMLPSFEEFVNLIKGTLLNFLEFLYRNKDNEEDKQKYSLLDKKPRGMFEATARKTIPLGTTVSNRQIYIKEQFVHLYTRSRNFKKINDFLKQIEEYKRIKKRIKDSNDYRRVATCYNELGILYLKIEDVETAYANFLEIKKICEEHNIKDLKNTANYNIACYYSLKNELEKASKFLKLTKDDPKLNELAKTDKHLENLRNDSTFHSLFDK